MAAAIADHWVKTPVIVGRRDDRSDPATKLADGLQLLGYKEKAVINYCAERGLPIVRPVMLVIAANTAEADEYGEILRSDEIGGGAWADSILVVHSNLKGDAKEQALADLDAVEDPGSTVRIIISVGMLKEGWDVKNVYVICSMRALVSKVLTEQTLGRGLRLPFGAYTGIELLDTVEVVAHERYEDLLRKANVLNEAFIDSYSRAELRRNAAGDLEVARRTGPVVAPVIGDPDPGKTPEPSDTPGASGEVGFLPVDQRAGALDQATSTLALQQQFEPRDDMPEIKVPILRMSNVEAHFSLTGITDLDPFSKLGRQLAASPDRELQRTKVSAKVIVGPDGLRTTELIPTAATDHLQASATLFPLEGLVGGLSDALLASPVVPARADQARAARPIIGAFLEGLGPDAEPLLSAYAGRAAARLVKLVTDEHRKFASEPRMEEVVKVRPIGGTRISNRKVELDRSGRFSKGSAYDSWARSVYAADWFDSRPERSVAIIADDANEVRCWIRLQVGELPILWRSDGRQYNADLIVVENNGSCWVVEVKADDAMTSVEVQAKRKAAKRWVTPSTPPASWRPPGATSSCRRPTSTTRSTRGRR